MVDLPTLARSEKALSAIPGWIGPEPETGYVWFETALEIGGVTERAFYLHGGAFQRHPDRHVVFEVRIGKSPGRRCVPLMRMEWRSLKKGHTNKRRRGHPLSGRRVGNTHLHLFDDNWRPDRGVMYPGDLPFATEPDRELVAFRDVCTYVGVRFRITNMDIVPPPPWEPSLFAEFGDGDPGPEE
jgi:hypothetical protein